MMQTRRSFLQSSLGAGLLGLADVAATQPEPGNELDTELAATGFRGEMITPGSPRYAQACRMFVANPRYRARPRLIAMCSDERDVVRAIAFARTRGIELSVRAGGHDLMAASLCDGLVVDLSAMQLVHVDPAVPSVRIGAGVRAGRLNPALGEAGFAAALGCASQVGVTGLVLGGGLGWLVGRHGAACDHLIAARVVTADGHILQVDEQENSDLLWALRGGGGNFGVVTEMTLAIHPVPRVIQGVVALRVRHVARFLRRYSAYLEAAGDDLDLETYLMAPHGETMAFIKACYHGDQARSERTLAPLRALASFAADDLASGRYSGAVDPTGSVLPLFRSAAPARRSDDAPGLHVGSTSMISISDAAAEIIEDGLARARGSWVAGIAHYVHGAAAAPERRAAMLRIDQQITAYFLTTWLRADEARPQMTWVDNLGQALQPHAAPTYVNYLTSNDPAAVRRAYGRGYRRLQAIKRVYDPHNVFRRNRNISPSA